MKRDFSNWFKNKNNNFIGVLHQQGKVLLDSDWNDEIIIKTHWQDQIGQDVIGSGVAAVLVNESKNFLPNGIVSELKSNSKEITLFISPGKLRVDGTLIYLNETEEGKLASRIATLLDSENIRQEQIKLLNKGNLSKRFLIFLEVWREAFNAFQDTTSLIEPALGGPDTSERLATSYAFKLIKVKNKIVNYSNIINYIKYKEKVRLTVSPQPEKVTNTECPKTDKGGYTGLEHQFYRIEIADVDQSNFKDFKWFFCFLRL